MSSTIPPNRLIPNPLPMLPSATNPTLNQSLPKPSYPMITRSKSNALVDYVDLSTHPFVRTIYNQAKKYPHWNEAMKAKYEALMKNQTWELVPYYPSQNVVDCKWLFHIKFNPNGTIDRYKARHVAKGFTQGPGLDYDATFSTIVKPTIVCLVLAIATQYGWPINQLDVNNAFLQGHIHEVVYLRQPPGFEQSHLSNHVCQLKKAIYGLKQALRAWYTELQSYLEGI